MSTSRRNVKAGGCGLALSLGVMLAPLAGLAQGLSPADLPGARPGSTQRLVIPRLDEGTASETPKAAEVAPAPASALPASALPANEPPKAAVLAPVEPPKAEPPKVESTTMQPAQAESRPAPVAGVVIEEAAIRAYLEPHRARFRLKPEEVSGFVEGYGARGGKPLFLEEAEGGWRASPKLEALAKHLATAGQDGLDSQRLMALLPAARSGLLEGARRAEVELAGAFAAFLYARDARGGRLEPSRLSALITPTLYLPPPAEVMAGIEGAGAQTLGAALARYNPQHPGFARLKAELAKLDEPAAPVITANVASAPGAPAPEGQLPPDFMAGGPLKPGQADPRVPLLRIRLNLPASASNIFDADLKEALKAFQRANELTPNGQLTPRTRAALENRALPANPEAARADKRQLRNTLLVNMERWRWLPPDLGTRHVFVNIPAYGLKVMENGAAVHQARVIVGKPATPTPVFSDTFAHVIVNPSWYVPPSIIKKEFLPRLASDPSYAARRGFQVVQGRHGISVRQPPGERNALGYVKFIFPNRHSVYLHDTSSRGLFSSEVRAFSHGCVRVDQPFALAEKLLARSGGFSEAQLKGMIGRGERMIKLEEAVRVHLGYFTLVAEEAGGLQHYRDLYGHDARVRAALAL